MPSDINKGRAIQLAEEHPEDGSHSVWIAWLARAVVFLLCRYIDGK